jgi:hypothetical protein
VIVAFLDSPEPERRCHWCGRPLRGRATKWCPGDACRKHASRWKQMILPQPASRETHATYRL